MKITKRAKETVLYKRHATKMRQDGYLSVEPDWRILRGGMTDHKISDVQIDLDGKTIWYKLAPR